MRRRNVEGHWDDLVAVLRELERRPVHFYVDSADELSMPIAVLVAGNGQLRLEVLEGGLKLTVGATTLWFWRSRFVRFRTVFLIDEPIEDWFEVHLTEAVVVYLARRPPTKAIARFAIFSS